MKEYKTRLIVFPKKANKPKKGDADVRYMLFFKQKIIANLL